MRAKNKVALAVELSICSENKGADQLRGHREADAKLICVFVFAYAKPWFSHDAAQLIVSAIKFEQKSIL